MIVPSIDLQDGQAVQLVGGESKALDAGDPRPIAARFGRVGEVAVIDLDAAIGTGSNASTVTELLSLARCRVGGGIRDEAAALGWLDAGAEKIIIGTAATPELLSRLPRERVIAALDGVRDEVVVDGWRTRTGATVLERMTQLRAHVDGFLVTFVELEGRMQGIDLERAKRLKAAAGDRHLTVAGGVRDVREVAALDALGIDVQVGMALYTGRLDLAGSLAAMLHSDREDGLWPTVVCDDLGQVLGLVWSSEESLREALESGRGVYQSRSRGLWRKGESSGNAQELYRVELDCDRDALRFVVRQEGSGFCHLGTWTCFGDTRGLAELERTIAARSASAPAGSYTRRLLDEPGLLRAKLGEEAAELANAGSAHEVCREAADLLYFAFTRMRAARVSLAAVAEELDRRALRVTRRGGGAKPASPGMSTEGPP